MNIKTVRIFAFVVTSIISFFIGYHFGVQDTIDLNKNTSEERTLLTQCIQQNALWIDLALTTLRK